MAIEQIIRKLADQARLETPPVVNVTRGVMVALAQRRREQETDAPLTWFALCSAAVAVPVLLLALTFWEAYTDPLLEMFFVLPWGMP